VAGVRAFVQVNARSSPRTGFLAETLVQRLPQLGIVHVAASRTMGVGPKSQIDRPLAVARYSARALAALGDLARDPPMLAAASFASPSSPCLLNEPLEFGLREWVAASRAELTRTVPSTDVIRNVMNEASICMPVSARLLDTAEGAGDLAADATCGARCRLHTSMQETGKADRLWGSRSVVNAAEVAARKIDHSQPGLPPRGRGVYLTGEGHAYRNCEGPTYNERRP
jgi:hypothetical protein